MINKNSLHDITDTFSEADISSYLKWQKKQNIGFIPPKKVLLPDSVISFGKYKDKKLKEIYLIDRKYLVWLTMSGIINVTKEYKNFILAI